MPTTYAKPVSSGPSVISTNLQLYVTEGNWGYRPNYTYINILIYIYIIYIYIWSISYAYEPLVPPSTLLKQKLRKNKTNNPQVLYMLELKQQLRTKTTTTTITNDIFPLALPCFRPSFHCPSYLDPSGNTWQHAPRRHNATRHNAAGSGRITIITELLGE